MKVKKGRILAVIKPQTEFTVDADKEPLSLIYSHRETDSSTRSGHAM